MVDWLVVAGCFSIAGGNSTASDTCKCRMIKYTQHKNVKRFNAFFVNEAPALARPRTLPHIKNGVPPKLVVTL